MKPATHLVRLALALHGQLSRPEPYCQLSLPSDRWWRCDQLIRRIRRAEARGWRLAARRLRVDFQYALRNLLSPLETMDRELGATPPATYSATAAEIFADLAELEERFGAVEWELKAHWLSVTTRPITLSGHYLGPFEIRLDWHRLQRDPAYRILARDPQPAAAQEEVTHPHVRSEILCEGEGHLAIGRALAQGRFLDFFELVANVLETYNGDSAFVGLDVWNGLHCTDCGDLAGREESLVCERREDTVCSDCHSTCGRCEASLCSDCVGSCAYCRSSQCGHCLTRCAACREPVCSECLDLDERCPNCVEDDETCDDVECSLDQEPSLAIQPDGLGQAPIGS
jgi:hypothetical protein